MPLRNRSSHAFAKNQKAAGTWARTAVLSGRGVPSTRAALHLRAHLVGHLLDRYVADPLLAHPSEPPGSADPGRRSAVLEIDFQTDLRGLADVRQRTGRRRRSVGVDQHAARRLRAAARHPVPAVSGHRGDQVVVVLPRPLPDPESPPARGGQGGLPGAVDGLQPRARRRRRPRRPWSRARPTPASRQPGSPRCRRGSAPRRSGSAHRPRRSPPGRAHRSCRR